jgi:hexosaminidase
MARYKLNTLHFHLTEDEGWRLEIEGLPELTTVGGRRGHTLDASAFLPPAYGSGPEVDRPFGSGFYSKADYLEILRYAAARHIEVIPELEMPGHARAAIKAMEARFRRLQAAGDTQGATRYLLSDPEDRSVYTSAQGYHDNVMNPALPSTYAFVERVVEAVAALHREAGVPLRNLHMGGDEVPAGVWEKSPAAQRHMKEQRLSSVDDLWFVFYGRVEQILKANGLVLSGWEEIAVRKTRRDGRDVFIPNPAFAERGWRTYVWNNIPGGGSEDLAYRLANGGFKVVLCPATSVYLDFAANPNPEEPGLDWGGYVGLEKPREAGLSTAPCSWARTGSPTTAEPTSSASKPTSGRRPSAATGVSTTCWRRSSSASRSGRGPRSRPGRARPTRRRWPPSTAKPGRSS